MTASHPYAESIIDLPFKELQKLEKLGLYYKKPELAILCIKCGFALKPNSDRISRHLGENHDTAKGSRRGLNPLIRSLNLPDPEGLPLRPDGSFWVSKHESEDILDDASISKLELNLQVDSTRPD